MNIGSISLDGKADDALDQEISSFAFLDFNIGWLMGLSRVIFFKVNGEIGGIIFVVEIGGADFVILRFLWIKFLESLLDTISGCGDNIDCQTSEHLEFGHYFIIGWVIHG